MDFKKFTVKCVCGALEIDHWYITLPMKRQKNTVFTLFFTVKFYPFNFKSKNIIFLRDRHMTLWSHHITSRMTVRTTDIDLNLGAVLWFQKGLTTLNSLLLMLERNTYGCILFWALGRPIIYVLRYFILCHFVYI